MWPGEAASVFSPPPFQGEEINSRGRGEDGAARLPVRPSRAFPNGPP